MQDTIPPDPFNKELRRPSYHLNREQRRQPKEIEKSRRSLSPRSLYQTKTEYNIEKLIETTINSFTLQEQSIYEGANHNLILRHSNAIKNLSATEQTVIKKYLAIWNDRAHGRDHITSNIEMIRCGSKWKHMKSFHPQFQFSKGKIYLYLECTAKLHTNDHCRNKINIMDNQLHHRTMPPTHHSLITKLTTLIQKFNNDDYIDNDDNQSTITEFFTPNNINNNEMEVTNNSSNKQSEIQTVSIKHIQYRTPSGNELHMEDNDNDTFPEDMTPPTTQNQPTLYTTPPNIQKIPTSNFSLTNTVSNSTTTMIKPIATQQTNNNTNSSDQKIVEIATGIT
jgi:hypothetical protein